MVKIKSAHILRDTDELAHHERVDQVIARVLRAAS